MARARRPSVPLTMISLTAVSTALLLLIFSYCFLLQAQGASSSSSSSSSSSEESYSYVPVRSVVYRTMSPAAMTEAAAYEPFSVCEGCRCCASPTNASSCVDTSCCYGIDCNLPGKPFGTCAFTPKTCGCGAANNCTQPPS